ncbi:hypothetical protein CR513_29880, partial [Mucuna pruriens]
MYKKGVFDIKFNDTDHQWVDICMKPLLKEHFSFIRDNLHIHSLIDAWRIFNKDWEKISTLTTKDNAIDKVRYHIPYGMLFIEIFNDMKIIKYEWEVLPPSFKYQHATKLYPTILSKPLVVFFADQPIIKENQPGLYTLIALQYTRPPKLTPKRKHHEPSSDTPSTQPQSKQKPKQTIKISLQNKNPKSPQPKNRSLFDGSVDDDETIFQHYKKKTKAKTFFPLPLLTRRQKKTKEGPCLIQEAKGKIKVEAKEETSLVEALVISQEVNPSIDVIPKACCFEEIEEMLETFSILKNEVDLKCNLHEKTQKDLMKLLKKIAINSSFDSDG